MGTTKGTKEHEFFLTTEYTDYTEKTINASPQEPTTCEDIACVR